MSDDSKQSSSPEEQKPAAAEAKPAAPAAKAPAEPPPPPPAGVYGKLLDTKKWDVTHLGPDAQGIEMVQVAGKDLLAAAEFLKTDSRCRFDLLVSVTGVDWKTHRESVAHLYSTETHEKLALKTTAEDEHVPSLYSVWNTADWHERESYDLLGIIYDGHPNLERIMMPVDWLGHPLRKDYKVDDPRLVWNER